jgi:hypothetical protein
MINSKPKNQQAMKHYQFYLMVLLISSLTIIGCKDSDSIEVDSTPFFDEVNEGIESLPGLDLTIEAVISDPAGIKSVNIKYQPWFLDKTIVKDSLPKSYRLRYNFRVPQEEVVGSSHTIPITVTNVGGKTTMKEIVVLLDKDITLPTINVVSPLDGSTVFINNGNEIEFNITCEDKSLTKFEITSSLLNDVVTLSGTTSTYTKSLNVDTPGTYPFKISVTDATKNVRTRTIIVNVFDKLKFTKIYITNETSDLNLASYLFGAYLTTQPSTVAEEKDFVFTTKYYAETPMTKVRFIPQKTSFSPFAIGANPSVAGKLAIGSDASVNPIVLEQSGYYDIKIDLRDLTYTATKYTATGTTYSNAYIIGRGVRVGTTTTCTLPNGTTACWSFTSSKPFVADPANPYRWTLDVTLEDQPNDAGVNGFILNANPSTWSPFWRFDNKDSPEATVLNGGVEYVYAPDKFGNYKLTFDTHLNRLIAKKR